MIRTLPGLAVSIAIALILAVCVVALAPDGPRVAERTLAPDLTEQTVERIVFARAGATPIEIVRSAERTGWKWVEPDAAYADPVTIDAALAALRGGRWHRLADASVAGTMRGEIRIVAGARTLVFAIGSDVPGAGQTWLVHDGAALLVDQWVTRALLPEPLALRVRFPAAVATVASAITDRTLRLEGAHLVRPLSLWIDEARVRALIGALAELEIVSLDKPQPGERTRRIELETATGTTFVEHVGGCLPDRLLIDSSYGTGCVEHAAWERVTGELDRFVAPQAPTELAEPRPVPFAPRSVRFADGTLLELAGRPRVADADVDPESLGALLAVLAAPASVTSELPAGAPRTTLVVSGEAGITITLDVHANTIVRRGEPVALAPGRGGLAVLARPASALRDPVLWREDPITLSSLVVDRVEYRRGAVLGEWTRQPSGTADADLVDALASTVATVRAPPGPAPAKVVHTIAVTFTPPAGPPMTHTIELGSASPRGCAARIDHEPVVVDLALCTAAAALATATKKGAAGPP